jgi:hypothetical protein
MLTDGHTCPKGRAVCISCALDGGVVCFRVTARYTDECRCYRTKPLVIKLVTRRQCICLNYPVMPQFWRFCRTLRASSSHSTVTEMLGSTLYSKIDHRDGSSSRFARHLYLLAGTSPQNGPRSLPFTSFPLIHYYSKNLCCIAIWLQELLQK